MAQLNESTSARIAKIASRGLRTGKLTEAEIREVSGSALTQFPSHVVEKAKKDDADEAKKAGN